MNKIIYIIPGFSHRLGLYKKIIESFDKQGFRTVPIKISWKCRVMSDYVEEFLSQLIHTKKDKVYLFGFSLGAMIALISSVKIKPNGLILCSLSPYFREDLNKIRESWKNFMGKRRISDYKKFSFNKISKTCKSKVYLIYGTEESKELRLRVVDANKRVKNSQLVVVEGCKHDISDKRYIKAVQKVISKL